MSKIMVVVLICRQLRHGFKKEAKVSPNFTVAYNYVRACVCGCVCVRVCMFACF